jgi:hypothetical protein
MHEDINFKIYCKLQYHRKDNGVCFECALICFPTDPLVDVMCDVENPDLCQYQSNCTVGSKFQWSRDSGRTPSKDTGPYTDGNGNPQGKEHLKCPLYSS